MKPGVLFMITARCSDQAASAAYDDALARLAARRYGCLEPWADHPAAYGRMAMFEGYARCQAPVMAMMRELMQRNFDCLSAECDEWLDAAANAATANRSTGAPSSVPTVTESRRKRTTLTITA